MKGIEYYRESSFDMIEVKTCCDDLHSYKSHIHRQLSIGFISKGSTQLNVNGRDYYIEAGEAVVILPFVSHRCQPIDINNWEFTMIYIDNEFYRGNPELLGNENSIGVKKLDASGFEKIRHLSELLKSNASPFDKEVELTNTLNELFEKCDVEIPLHGSEEINMVKKYIEEHFLDTFQLKEMEQCFNINKFALIRNFKKEYNTTPNAYQLQLKVDYGKKLLKGSDDIADVAVKAGFYDQAHFTREFKRAFGTTPLQYCKAVR